MSEFKDKVLLVTGAGRGIGRAVARAFGTRGAIVAANDLTPVSLDKTIEIVLSVGGRARDYVFDVCKKMPVQTMVEGVLDDWGRIDFLVNCAQVKPKAPLLSMDEWDWRRTVDVNLTGPFLTMQSVGRVMREAGSGAIVNIAASAGRAHGLADRGAYIASKMGLVGLTRAAALEFAPHNIRVNAVCPGWGDGDSSTESQAQAGKGGKIPLGRPASPGQVAALALFLCSPAAGALTGQVINLNGDQVTC